ncbi:MAG TPA: hypothetical protein VNN07_16270 [Candidatus Tectomicrobia bacterium]|nr:hypothetical protein [Candidatus Tectomicrobia bacterium]
MARAEALERLVQRVAREIRRRRAEHWALRGAFWGGLLAVLVLLAKAVVGPLALPVAAGLGVVAALAGALWGATRPIPMADAARLADRAWGLDDRVTTALQWADREDRTPLVDALVADATTRIERLEPRRAVRRLVPRDGRWTPVPLAVALALALAPAVPMPTGILPDFSAGADEREEEQRAGVPMLEDRSRPTTPERVKPPAFEERDFAARAGGAGSAMTGDLSAIFKDTALSGQRPDFQSFLKTGDERLKLLEQADRLPDLQSDFTASPYRVMFRKSRELRGGLRPDQVSPEKLRELLEEMERLGRKGGGDWSGEAMEGMEALEGGDADRALEAMQKALDKMRAQEEARHAGKGLRGGRDRDRGTGRDRDGVGGEGAPEDGDFGEGFGLMPGKGKSAAPKGEASQRLRATPYDVGVEGEARRGRKDAYDTNLAGRGGPMPSRLQYLGVIGRYRKMMEDAIARESIPRDYHGQIKDYFEALDER